MTNDKLQMTNKLFNSKLINKFGIWVLFGFWIFSFGILTALPSAADSVWNKASASPYSTQKAYKVGDIVNILIVESTSAQNKAGTKTDVRDDLGTKFLHNIQRLRPSIDYNNQITGNISNKYTGLGQTSRVSRVQARIAAWVEDVLPNGNLSIQGKHKVVVNDETQEITIAGIVRPKDISGSNTVFSYQVANAEVGVKGSGVVAEGESPGWLTRLFNWLF
jgi:flagellar L-ring protein precursor FlgH